MTCSKAYILNFFATHRSVILFVAFVLLQKFSFAQSLKDPAYIGYSFAAGKIIKNFPVFPELKMATLQSVTIGNKLNGTRAWHPYYKFPMASFQFIYGSLGNRKEVGAMFNLLYRLEFQFKLNDKLFLEAIPAFGGSYFTKRYDELDNPNNVIIGSHLTFCAAATVGIRYFINPFWSVDLQGSIYHYSNSHYKLPNSGANITVAGLGMRYHIKPATFLLGEKSLLPDKKTHLSVRIALGQNEQGNTTFPVNGPRYPIYLAAFYATKYVTPVNKLHAGLEGWYNTGVYDFITSQEYYDDNLRWRSTALQFVLGHEFLMGHFSMLTNGGVYLYNPVFKERLKRENNNTLHNKLKSRLTARIGFQYYLHDATLYSRNNWFAGVYIKTNLGQADFLEGSIGYCF